MEQFQQASPGLGGGRGRAKLYCSFLSCYHKQRSTRLEAESLGGHVHAYACVYTCVLIYIDTLRDVRLGVRVRTVGESRKATYCTVARSHKLAIADANNAERCQTHLPVMRIQKGAANGDSSQQTAAAASSSQQQPPAAVSSISGQQRAVREQKQALDSSQHRAVQTGSSDSSQQQAESCNNSRPEQQQPAAGS